MLDRLLNNKVKGLGLIIFSEIGACLTFKEHMTKLRVLSKSFKDFIEKNIENLCQERLLYYNFKPGFVYPQRNNKII